MTLLSLSVKLTSVSLLRTEDPSTKTRMTNPIPAFIVKSNLLDFIVSIGSMGWSADGIFKEALGLEDLDKRKHG